MGGTAERIVQVLESPDGKVQAVRMNREAGATVSDSVFIYIVPKGEGVSWTTKTLVRLNRYRDVEMGWKSGRELKVTYAEANIIESESEWSSHEVDGGRYQVKIDLHQKP
jgi:hypothetical protein